MEKVWDELRKIEKQAEKIRSEAQNKSKNILAFAEKEAEKLEENSKVCAEKDAKEQYYKAVKEVNRVREEKLKEVKAEAEKLKRKAKERLDEASDKIVDAVLGENAP